MLAGDPSNDRPEAQGNVVGDAFACPDRLAFNACGAQLVQTDIGNRALNQSEFARLGNNAMMACDVSSDEMRRFLTSPVGCEITGAAWIPDGRPMVVNVQHHVSRRVNVATLPTLSATRRGPTTRKAAGRAARRW